jgi:hypothetical protein
MASVGVGVGTTGVEVADWAVDVSRVASTRPVAVETGVTGEGVGPSMRAMAHPDANHNRKSTTMPFIQVAVLVF